ncbi:response regulator transcription factor [Clostridium sp. DL1XJH146]
MIIRMRTRRIKDPVEGLDRGADDCLTKSFAVDELFARIRTMTRRKSDGRAEKHIVLGNVKLDLVNSKIFLEGGSEFLGNKEFQMMEFFINNKEYFVSADGLVERI